MAHSPKSEKKLANLQPFGPGPDARRGRGPAKGAPNAGRPPDWLKEQMAQGRERAVEKLVARLDATNPLETLDNDQMLKLVEKWAPPEDQVRETPTLIVKFVRE